MRVNITTTQQIVSFNRPPKKRYLFHVTHLSPENNRQTTDVLQREHSNRPKARPKRIPLTGTKLNASKMPSSPTQTSDILIQHYNISSLAGLWNYAQTECGMTHLHSAIPRQMWAVLNSAQLWSRSEHGLRHSPLHKCSHLQQPAPNGHHQVQLCLMWHLWEQVMSFCTTISPMQVFTSSAAHTGLQHTTGRGSLTGGKHFFRLESRTKNNVSFIWKPDGGVSSETLWHRT